MTTTDVENFPGFRKGIMGPDLMGEMREQAAACGAELRAEDVDAVNLDGGIKSVVVDGVEHRARAVVLAMGASPRYLNIPGEQELLGRGVSSCATCDGFFFRGRDVVVIGGGDSAMEEATFLARMASSVTIIHRRAEFRASRVMVDRAKNNGKIRWELEADVVSVNGNGKVASITVRDRGTKVERDIDAAGVFVAIGHEPRSALVRGMVEMDDAGYVKVRGRSSRTSIDGVFAAGDLVDHTYRQAVTAAGSGCVAAMDVERWLAS